MAEKYQNLQLLEGGRDVLVARRDEELKSVIRYLEDQHFDKDDLLGWAEHSLPYARVGVLAAAEVMGLHSLDLEAWTGIQGAGKGTNLQAIREASTEFLATNQDSIPNSFMSLLRRYVGEMGEIKTGTGGMFFRPQPGTEYEEIFAPIGQVSKPYTEAGELVPDTFVSTMVALMIRKRILEGKTGVQIDLYPRDGVQHNHTLELMGQLEKAGVSSSLTVVDLRLLPQEAVDMLAVNPVEFSEAAIRMGLLLNDFHQNAKKFTGESSENQFDNIDKALTLWEKMFPKDSASWWLVQETKGAVKRMRSRGRDDDNDPLALIKRLASYYGSTMPGLTQINGVKFISADQKPSAVVYDLVRSLIDPAIIKSPAVQKFIYIAQNKAEAIVRS